MKERNKSLPSGNDDGADLQPISTTSARTTLIFAGDPSQVSAGFALALRLMGFNTPAPDASETVPPQRRN